MTKDHYLDARNKNRASTKALMKRSGYADGGPVPKPTPRPPFGADDQKTEQPDPYNPDQTDVGHLNTKNGDFMFENNPSRIIRGTGVSVGHSRGGKTKGTKS